MKLINQRDGAVRFERREAGQSVFARYRRIDNALIIDHVEAEPALWGTGSSGRLMEEILDLAGADDLSVTATCPWAARWLERRPPTPGQTAPTSRAPGSGRQPAPGVNTGVFAGLAATD